MRFSSTRPLLVTVRLTRDAAELGRRRLHQIVRAVFIATHRLVGFRIVHYCVQHNHLHFIVEASSRAAMTCAMRSINIRIGRRVNLALGRTRGQVVAHRYHERPLLTPTEARSALLYVLNNFRRHLWRDRGERCAVDYMDPCSSARYFDGWRDRARARAPDASAPVAEAQTALLRRLWRRRGLLGLADLPGEGGVASGKAPKNLVRVHRS